MPTSARVLLAGGDEPSLLALRQLLESVGHDVAHASTPTDAARRIGGGGVEVVVVLDELVGSIERLLEAQCANQPASFIVVGAARTAEWPQDLLRAGASDVVEASDDSPTLLVAVERAAREGRLKRELALLRARVGDAARQALVGRSAAISGVRELVGRAAASRAAVLVTGEAGTGRELVARMIHDLSERAARPLVTVRCAGADPKTLEEELFGRADADGVAARPGALEAARGGTIVVDDALALPITLRAQLAYASTSQATCCSGATERGALDVRVVLTARTSPATPDTAAIDDLITRFNALVIDVPPLRERRSDIPQLVQHFRQRLAPEQRTEVQPLASDVMLSLLAREWPENVRELEHWIERNAHGGATEPPRAVTGAPPGMDFSTSQATLEELERAYILHVLALESGHQSRTAARLGIDRRTLYRKLKQYRRPD